MFLSTKLGLLFFPCLIPSEKMKITLPNERNLCANEHEKWNQRELTNTEMCDSNALSTEYSRIFISRNVPQDRKNTRVGNCFPTPFTSLPVFSSGYFSLCLLVFFINLFFSSAANKGGHRKF